MSKFNIEGFATLQQIQDETTVLADLELKSYLNSLGAGQANFVADQIATAVTKTTTDKQTAFKRAFNSATNSDNAITQAGYYLTRSDDLNKLATDINQVTAKQVDAVNINKDLATRQYQINEWAAHNKLDTLFFLQVLFITLTLLGALSFLVKQGIMPNFLFIIFSMIFLLGAVITLFLRWRYTSTVRDPTYWNRRRFPA